MKSNFNFITDYHFGDKKLFNGLDFESHPYWGDYDFYKNEFAYIDAYRSLRKKEPQTFQNSIGLFDKSNQITTYDYLLNHKNSTDKYFYLLNIFGSAENSFELDDMVISKIHHKILEQLQRDRNLYLVINCSTEGFFPYDFFEKLHDYLTEKNINFEKVFFIHSNYRIWEYKSDFLNQSKYEETVNIVPYLWAIPFFHNKLNFEKFRNEKLNQQDYQVKEKDFNLLMRNQKTHRTRLLCDLDRLELVDRNNVSFDLLLNDNYSLDVYYNKFEEVLDTESDTFQKYWNHLNYMIQNKNKRTIDYDDLKKVEGINMETDLPYVDTNFTVVAESFFFEKEKVGYISEKVIKPMLHRHPFIVLSTPGTLSYLHSMGFKTFSETGFVDETYDMIDDDEERYYAVVEEIYKLCNLSYEQKEGFMWRCESILEHNYNNLLRFDMDKYNSEFAKHFGRIDYDYVSPVKTLL